MKLARQHCDHLHAFRTLRESRFRHPLLLIFVALALAGAGVDWHVAVADSATIAGPNTQDHPSSIKSANGSAKPVFLSAGRSSILPVGWRVLDGELTTRGLRPSIYPPADQLQFLHAPTAVLLLAAARSRLEFSYDGVIARSGGVSSFGTSLPPPLLA